MDCVNVDCDFDYLRTEITVVDYVRDRTEADVHILITGQRTSGGGREYTLKFLGQRQFAGIDDLLRYTSRELDTDDTVRRGLARMIKIGLVRFVAATPLADQIEVAFQPPAGPAAVRIVKDPWNLWFFRVRMSGNFDGEQRSSGSSFHGSASANRTTENWKVNLSVGGSHRERRFVLSGGETFRSVSKDLNFNGLLVKSLTSHWSVGLRGRAAASTFFNQDLAARVAPGLEYNLFPYSESTRRQLVFQYTAGPNHFDYEQETIFGKLAENLWDETLFVGISVRQPWGTTGGFFEASHYFEDFNKHRLVFEGDVELRLFKGLSLNVDGSASRIRDQLYLPRRGATDEEILVRRRQLETSYRYFFSLGFTYTFGSIYSNIVNPRFPN